MFAHERICVDGRFGGVHLKSLSPQLMLVHCKGCLSSGGALKLDPGSARRDAQLAALPHCSHCPKLSKSLC